MLYLGYYNLQKIIAVYLDNRKRNIMYILALSLPSRYFCTLQSLLEEITDAEKKLEKKTELTATKTALSQFRISFAPISNFFLFSVIQRTFILLQVPDV
jgi:hypothetical protein